MAKLLQKSEFTTIDDKTYFVIEACTLIESENGKIWIDDFKPFLEPGEKFTPRLNEHELIEAVDFKSTPEDFNNHIDALELSKYQKIDNFKNKRVIASSMDRCYDEDNWHSSENDTEYIELLLFEGNEYWKSNYKSLTFEDLKLLGVVTTAKFHEYNDAYAAKKRMNNTNTTKNNTFV